MVKMNPKDSLFYDSGLDSESNASISDGDSYGKLTVQLLLQSGFVCVFVFESLTCVLFLQILTVKRARSPPSL